MVVVVARWNRVQKNEQCGHVSQKPSQGLLNENPRRIALGPFAESQESLLASSGGGLPRSRGRGGWLLSLHASLRSIRSNGGRGVEAMDAGWSGECFSVPWRHPSREGTRGSIPQIRLLH